MIGDARRRLVGEQKGFPSVLLYGNEHIRQNLMVLQGQRTYGFVNRLIVMCSYAYDMASNVEMHTRLPGSAGHSHGRGIYESGALSTTTAFSAGYGRALRPSRNLAPRSGRIGTHRYEGAYLDSDMLFGTSAPILE